MKKILASLLIVCTLICAMTIFASAADDVVIKFRPDGTKNEGYIVEDTNAHVNTTQYFCDAGTHVTMKFSGDFKTANAVTFQCGVWGWLRVSLSQDNATWTDLYVADKVVDSTTMSFDLTDKIDKNKGDIYIRIAHANFEYTADGVTQKAGTEGGNGGSLLFNQDAILTIKNTKHDKVVPIYGFEEDIKGAPANTDNKVDGAASVVYTFGAADGTKVIWKNLDAPVDCTGCDNVELYFYVSDVALFDEIGGGQLEITSGGDCDKEETSWSTDSLKSHVVGTPKAGWNLLRFGIGGACDFSRVNYVRIYIPNCGADKEGKQIGLDMLYACGADATVTPTIAGNDPTPDDPTPATFDAVSSVAVAAVAALGVALVASKKRH
ncbi:MAG: hypothetical protein MJ070_07230 [Lachnospiraceae bacterium]|nr:hypothetical protein [Lachnospiraceae bacterium]